MDHTHCPNCGEKIKTGFLSSNGLISGKLTAFLNEYTPDKKPAYCESCWSVQGQEANDRYRADVRKYQEIVLQHIDKVPVLTLHSPLGWEYHPLEIVSGQSAGNINSSLTGTIFSEPTGYKKVISEEEQACIRQLRRKSLLAGGNAVIGVAFSYSSVPISELNYGTNTTTLNTSFIISAMGTAVRITNGSLLGDEWQKEIDAMKEARQKLDHLYAIKPEHIDDIDML